MKVKELITKLQECDQEAEVVYWAGNRVEYLAVDGVRFCPDDRYKNNSKFIELYSF